MARQIAVLAVVSILAAACGADVLQPTSTADPPATPAARELGITRVTCGGGPPSFPLAVLDQAAGIDPAEDQPAAILHAHLREVEGLPRGGWIRAAQTHDTVLFVARGGGVPWSQVGVQLSDGVWAADRWGQCRLQPELPPDLGIATFRVAADADLAPDTTEIEVLATEMACNSGRDARGRIVVWAVLPAADAMTVVLAVRPRPGGHDCQGNPETPFLLELPEPLGDRTLLDGSEIPARDATTCPERLGCP
jgi:hypothetical protein